MNNAISSIIDRKSSSAIKGLLIFLIVLGHCGLLMRNPVTEERRILYHYFYSFHVYCFFILPFLYGYIRKNSKGLLNVKNDIYKNFVKLYIPYIWICAICYLIYMTIAHGEASIGETLQAFITGECSLLGSGVGFGFPWFLPTMFIVLVLYSIWQNTEIKWIKVVILLISILCWVCITLKGISFFIMISQHVPFSILQGFRCFFLGYVTFSIISHVKSAKISVAYISVFVLLSLSFFLSKVGIINVKQSVFLLVMPISAFCFLYGIRGILSKSRFLVLLGEHSFGIYLCHVIILNIFTTILSHFGVGIGIVPGLVVFALSLSLSFGLTLLLDRMPKVKGILFPQVKKT